MHLDVGERSDFGGDRFWIGRLSEGRAGSGVVGVADAGEGAAVRGPKRFDGIDGGENISRSVCRERLH